MKRRLIGSLYVQVLIAVAAGILLGIFMPHIGSELKPLGDIFIRLIKMVFAPIIFATVVLGIAKMESIKDLGRVGWRALLYFEVLSTFALLLGVIVVNVVQPGHGMNVDPATLDTKSIAAYTAQVKHEGIMDFLLSLVPMSIVDALAKNTSCRSSCSRYSWAWRWHTWANAASPSSPRWTRSPTPCSRSSA